MLSPDKILLMTGRVRSLDLLPLSESFSSELSVERRLKVDEVVSVKPLLERLSDKPSENSDPFESISNSFFWGISSGLPCFFSLEKIDTSPISVTIRIFMYLNIVLPSQRKLKLNQSMIALKSIENIKVLLLVVLFKLEVG